MNQHVCKSIMDLHTCKTCNQQNCFLVKHHETKIDGENPVLREHRIKIEDEISTYCCVFLFFSNKPSFQNQPSVGQMIFATIYLSFYVLIFCISSSLFSGSMRCL